MRIGLAVILDVVYNHLGPDGNYLKCFSPHYFSTRHKTEWGEALNLDGEYAQGTRDFILGNARYWLSEFHLDGLRLDATQSIFDDSRPHILEELARSSARSGAAALDRRDLRERAAARAAAAAARAGRLRTRRDVERRLPSRREGRADRHARRLLRRLHRARAGIHLVRASAAFSIRASGIRGRRRRAASAAPGLPRVRMHRLPAEPRPGRQHVPRRSRACQLPRPAAIAR